MRIVVSRLEDFPPGERRIVQAGRRSIGVFRVGDNFYALNNYCPHQGGPLCLGTTQPWVTSARPGEFVLDEQEALVACPWHGWEYDLATGQSFLGPGEPPARTYDVKVEVASGEGEPKGGRIPGPYVAETYPVHVEDAYVVVETTSGSRRRETPGGEG
ncbi:Rieske (2Fe-2S) protein [Prauserella muralis]|uniref:Ferredoxin n=1 Tax=Prauserella muralis TaxID=588067 RepID=A0A2V4ANG4_9PSEU|nr:Rieske 2Fe-2S domain-containing protein [Prauserella muralis]PXY22142.1 ferredoxin [Prauserella muralis]TWE27741.1 nitrite reductase/ring-hydroxylating ferredoxin subunit [Prauserella muralis]